MQEIQSTERSQVKQELIIDLPKPILNKKKAIIIGVSVFLTLGAIVGLIVGLYFHFQPQSTPLNTAVSSTSDGNEFVTSKFQYTDQNLIDDNVNETISIMFAGMNGSTARRMLQSQDSQTYVDTTIHYQHESGMNFKIRNNKIIKVEMSIDDVLNYLSQQEQEGSTTARLLQTSSIQQTYDAENQMINTADIYNQLRSQVIEAIQNQYGSSVQISISQDYIYDLEYDLASASYVNSNSTDNARRLWFLSNIFHSIGHFCTNVFHKVGDFFKKDGPKILKYGALAVLSGVDILADPKDGIEHTIQNFRSGNVWRAVKNTAEDAANAWLPPYVSIPLDFVADTCFSNPPHLHCTWKGAQKAAKKDILPFVQKKAVTTAFDLLAS